MYSLKNFLTVSNEEKNVQQNHIYLNTKMKWNPKESEQTNDRTIERTKMWKQFKLDMEILYSNEQIQFE